MIRIYLQISFFVLGTFFSLGQDSIPQPPEDDEIDQIGNINLTRQFFFEGVDFAKEGKELVVVIDEPQTQLAEDLGYRIYRDTSFLNKISAEFYQDVDTTNGEVHLCGYDIYFYIKSGPNLKAFQAINSHCGLNDIGCENLELLVENGTKLKLDTLRKLDFENFSPKEIIPNDVIFTARISGGILQNIYSNFYNNCARPNWTYDGKFQTILVVDSITPINLLINQFFSKVDSLEYRNINYYIDYTDEYKINPLTLKTRQPTSIKLNVYLDKDCYHYFPEQKIEPLKQRNDSFEYKQGNNFMLLMR